MAELTSRMATLTANNDALSSRIGILNRAVRMREEHIEMLQHKARPPCTRIRAQVRA